MGNRWIDRHPISTRWIFKCGIFLGILLGMSGCVPTTQSIPSPSQPSPENLQLSSPTQVGNDSGPAAKYCTDLGYRTETRQAPGGTTFTVCIFPSGSTCEVWYFLNHQCGLTGPANSSRTPAPGTGETVKQAEDRVVHLLRSSLSNDLDLDDTSDALPLVKIQPVTWPDTCLGLRETLGHCIQQPTPGFLVVLTDGQTNYTFHTDYSGLIAGQEPISGHQPSKPPGG